MLIGRFKCSSLVLTVASHDCCGERAPDGTGYYLVLLWVGCSETSPERSDGVLFPSGDCVACSLRVMWLMAGMTMILLSPFELTAH